jgi:hypothetical protein
MPALPKVPAHIMKSQFEGENLTDWLKGMASQAKE